MAPDGWQGHSNDPALTGWTPVLPRTKLKADNIDVFPVEAPVRATHVRLTMYPDGGISRLRVRGTVDGGAAKL